MYIVFENQGEIDPQLITLLGVNVKESTAPIGYFGTGLKYSVACAMRWGAELLVQSGVNQLEFSSAPTTIRGKQFDLITMHGGYDRLQLGFTTELGKNWEPWMVYRELWCNAHDEPGARVYTTDRVQPGVAGLTRIYVNGEELLQAHEARDTFILSPNTPMIVRGEGFKIYAQEGHAIFYRGIAVQKLEKPSLYTYNITSQLYLTEDRTAASWQTDSAIARGLSTCTDEQVIRQTLTASEDWMEARLDYSYVSQPSEIWEQIGKELLEKVGVETHRSLRNLLAPAEATPTCCPTCGRAY